MYCIAMSTTTETYFDTMGAALNAAAERAYADGAEFTGQDLLDAFSEPIYRCETRRAAIPLSKYRGSASKAINHRLVVSLYRMDSGTYELTTYIS